MKKAGSVCALDQVLKLWEDYCFIGSKLLIEKSTHANAKISEFEIKGPFRYYSELRKHLLENAAEGSYDYNRFSGSMEIEQRYLGELAQIAGSLFSWNHCSRKVLHLSANLQTLLSATSLEGMTWQDVHWPFDSFVITLEDSLIDENGNEYDCILIGRAPFINNPKIKSFYINILSKNLGSYVSINQEKINKMAKKKRLDSDKIHKKLKHMRTDFVKCSHLTTQGFDGTNINPITKPFIESQKDFLNFFSKSGIPTSDIDEYGSLSLYDKVNHLIANVCLFLETLPPKKLIGENESQKEKLVLDVGLLDPTAITKEENIFTVACEGTLSEESQILISEIKNSRIYREKAVHWRRGHWRRIGINNDDSYLKKIWIHPALINKHRLPESALPCGSKTNLI